MTVRAHQRRVRSRDRRGAASVVAFVREYQIFHDSLSTETGLDTAGWEAAGGDQGRRDGRDRSARALDRAACILTQMGHGAAVWDYGWSYFKVCCEEAAKTQ